MANIIENELENCKKAISGGDCVALCRAQARLYNEVDSLCMGLFLSKETANQIIGDLTRQLMEFADK